MASSESTFDERIGLVDCFEECKESFSQQHYELLIHKALAETREGAGKLKYFLALARRCKSGAVPVSVLAESIDKEYSASPVPQEQEGGGHGESVDRHEDVETELDEADDQNEEQQQDNKEEEEEGEQEQGEAPHANERAKKLVDAYEEGFFSGKRWNRSSRTFVLPGEGYWLDSHRIQKFRKSTQYDLASATPKPMPVFIDGNPLRHIESKQEFKTLEMGYHLCKKVAVSFDGEIFRATDGEILAALAKTKGAPQTDAPTYVKAVQELRRRHTAKNALKSGGNPSEAKRRRIQVAA